ncbi:MAG: N-acetylneuraminate synthase family protein [Treponema sp.]|jgi:sialic acid synthase SpsE|nr:N-acetylneuraminate synthase family protein [Treponema sp.]
MGNCLIIAEMGTSHGGDRVKASEIVAAAAESGADCVKCQIVYADEILHPETGVVSLPGGAVPLYEVFKKLEQKPEFYENIKEETENRGLLFLATPFGPKSAAVLKKMAPKAVKIASPELNYRSLVAEAASWKVPAYLSTGISLLGDIERAIEPFRGEEQRLCLLHCITAYPAPAEEYNLRLIPLLGGIFGCEAGVSDHSLDPVLVPVLASALGASAIEKHFCLSRDDPGLDDPIALPPGDFAVMVKALRRAFTMKKEAVVAEIAGAYGAERTEKVLGDGVRRLAPAEKANYERTRRSIHALRAIQQGETITGDMIAVLRTEKTLRPGLAPLWIERIAGKQAKNDIPAGQGIRFEDVF